MKFYLFIIIVSMSFQDMFTQSDSLRYIFYADEIDQNYFESYTVFSPSIAQVEYCDILANVYVQNNYDSYSWTNKIENYYMYYRQYVGLIDSIGNKIIFIDAYCRNPYPTKNETKRPFGLVKGGGSCYFNLKVNLDINECYELKVNGPK